MKGNKIARTAKNGREREDEVEFCEDHKDDQEDRPQQHYYSAGERH